MTEIATPSPTHRASYRSSLSRSFSSQNFKMPWKVEETFSPGSSRSPSPTSKDGSTKDDNSSISSASSDPKESVADLTKVEEVMETSKRKRFSKYDKPPTPVQLLEKKQRRPMSMNFMRSSASEPNVATLNSMVSSSSSVSLASENSSTLNKKSPKDDLWYGYRSLENDYTKFTGKSNIEKGTVVRMCLLPFIRKFEKKSSSANIPMEELDRRIRVLNKWWTALLASLRNHNSAIVNGNDRPSYYEAILGIMSRPEWRSSPSTLAPYSKQNPDTSSSFSSLASASSHYSIQKSVQHNMRSFFTGALADTLSFVVEKMAIRQSASMISFAGKVLAYAFFFCNTVGEILVGLWNIQPTSVRRVLSEHGFGRGTDLQEVAADIINEFPLCIQSLGFTSLSSVVQYLKRPAKIAPLGANIDWRGPWLSRWLGRDTDTLFIFIKNYYILLDEYLPPGSSPAARLCAPGFIYVQAQVLTHLDNILHPQQLNLGMDGQSLTSNQHLENNGPSTTFDEVLADAQSSALQIQNNRSGAKSHFDQRVFSIAKELCSDRSVSITTKHIFGETFGTLLRAAARKVRVVDHTACVLVCDILEEAIPLLLVLERTVSGANFIDWGFWMDVCKQILLNENSMSELRLFAFIYGMWDCIVENEERKRTLVLDWLIEEAAWNRFFSHWCPMIRSYYMRVICWRVARFAGNATDLDTLIFEKLSHRLHTTFATHTWLKSQADKGLLPRPSTAPCPPAPGRKLSIVRSDNQGSNKMFSLDALLPSAMRSTDNIRPKSISGLSNPTENPKVKDTSDTMSIRSVDSTMSSISTYSTVSVNSGIRRRWSGFFKGIWGASSPESAKLEVTQGPRVPPPKMLQTSSNQRPAIFSSGRRIHYKFSLEQADRATHIGRSRPISVPHLPSLTQEHLQLVADDDAEEVAITYVPPPVLPTYIKYASRALAEWTLVVDECDNFMERRKMEGQHNPRGIDIPCLSIDSLRR